MGTIIDIAGTSAGPAGAEELKAFITACCAAGRMPMIVGDPGVGKTAVVREWSWAHGCGEPVCLVGSQLDPTDVAGLPHASVEREGHTAYAAYLVPEWQQRLMDGRPHVLFFDEFSNTSRSVQAALLKIIGERRFANGEPIPANVHLIGAMNPESTAVDYNPLPAPMINRMVLVSYEPRMADIVDGLEHGFPDPAELAGTLPAPAPADDRQRGAWGRLLARFLKAEPNHLVRPSDVMRSGEHGTCDEDAYGAQCAGSESERFVLDWAWASPRSWEAARDLLAATPSPLSSRGELNGFQLRLLRGTVGVAGASRLASWLHKQRQVDPFEVIRDITCVDWEHGDLNTVTEAAHHVEHAVADCDGRDGRPGPEEALAFYELVAGIAGEPPEGCRAPLASHLSGESPARRALEAHVPDGTDPREWHGRIMAVYAALFSQGLMHSTKSRR